MKKSKPKPKTTITVTVIPETQYRVIRILEYTGTIGFLSASLVRRAVKGQHCVLTGTIREAFLGDFPFSLTPAEPITVEEVESETKRWAAGKEVPR